MITRDAYKIAGATNEPFSLDEELNLIARWQKRRHKKSRDKVVKNYILFAVKTARSFYPELPEDESLRLAHAAVLDAINRTKVERRSRLSTMLYFSVRICRRLQLREGELIRCPDSKLGKNSRVIINPAGAVSRLAEPTGGSWDELLGTSASAADHYDEEERRSCLLQAMEKLDATQKKILQGLFFEGKSLAAVGASLRPPVTAEAVRQRRDKALAVLRKALEKLGLSSAV
jgi:RNA polymerase sigma factor (sigma-70 family)